MKYMILEMTGKYNVNIMCGYMVHIHIFMPFYRFCCRHNAYKFISQQTVDFLCNLQIKNNYYQKGANKYINILKNIKIATCHKYLSNFSIIPSTPSHGRQPTSQLILQFLNKVQVTLFFISRFQQPCLGPTLVYLIPKTYIIWLSYLLTMSTPVIPEMCCVH